MLHVGASGEVVQRFSVVRVGCIGVVRSRCAGRLVIQPRCCGCSHRRVGF